MKNASSTYIGFEESQKRQPVELYSFWKAGEVFNWRYTSGDVDVEFAGNTYESAPVRRGSVELDSELKKSILRIQFMNTLEPMDEFISDVPEDIIWVMVMKLHRQQDPLESSTVFVGLIKQVAFNGEFAEAECVGFESFLERQATRYRYHPSCNNTLFDTKCGVPKASYKVDATLDTISDDGTIITAAIFGTYADGYFTRGHLIDENGSERFIIYHIGTTIKLRSRITGLAASDDVDVYPGCDGRMTTCRDKYSNLNNFFGTPFIPMDNPVTRF